MTGAARYQSGWAVSAVPLPIIDWLQCWEIVECNSICENYVENLEKMRHIINETHLSATEQDEGNALSVMMGGLRCPPSLSLIGCRVGRWMNIIRFVRIMLEN